MDLGAEGPAALRPGRAATVEMRVTEADTASALGSGDVPVLATPRLVALAEAATVAATGGALPAGATSVGTRVEVEHLAATAVGGAVAAEAVLSTVEGRRLVFEVTVRDTTGSGTAVVARGRVHRVVVDRDRFLAGVAAG
jgi:fluoroacetyl-CoA thioesterase